MCVCVWERERERPLLFVEASAGAISASSATTREATGTLVGTLGRSNFSCSSDGPSVGTSGISWTASWRKESTPVGHLSIAKWYDTRYDIRQDQKIDKHEMSSLSQKKRSYIYLKLDSDNLHINTQPENQPSKTDWCHLAWPIVSGKKEKSLYTFT